MRPKVKISRKFAKDNFPKIYSAGYCSLQNLFHYISPDYYSTYTYGWACDYYYFDSFGILISTGYAPVGKSIPYEITSAFDKKAEEIICTLGPFHDWENKRDNVNELINHFLTTLTELKKGDML